MLRPDHFQVRYVINPWMEGNVNRAKQVSAVRQWDKLRVILSGLGEVKLITPQPGWPDMVFTANAGLALGSTAIISHFAHTQRQGEEPFFEKWFGDNGYTLHKLPPHLFFEGAGDALFDSDGARLWAAYGFRTSLETHSHLAKIFNVETVSLRLVDPRFYHLDTCFCPLPGGYLLYYPQALDISSNDTIDRLVPSDRRIHLGEIDAINFAANCVVVDKTIALHKASSTLKERLASAGFGLIETDLGEFMKAGGAAKCLTLRLDETVNTKRMSACQVTTREVEVEGQLIDSSLMGSICDLIVSDGGSFMVKDLRLGQKRNEPSIAKIEVTSPTGESLDHLVQKIIRLGARLPAGEEKDAICEGANQDGVAPEKFVATTIYPMQVRILGEWITVDNQRMDGVIVIEKRTARCSLIRDLKRGDQVVIGGEGTRLVRRPDERGAGRRFGFMASTISSERKVELAIERVAWEMNRIRERRGRLVVVAGPVVAHTGGAPSLAWMIRERYVSALLGGNAIAVHDIESAMFGTSLGVDLHSGRPATGGHRNHLAAINRIRGAGSIARAVGKGDLTSGLFFELVKQNIPFSLAGSIRDDGPLPETEMDLIRAQEDYARLIKGADMILMLSTMLHSIGTGNMTPAGVKLVCVDINPAVVTKLADRGSLESVGIVTDVGLFLSILRQRLFVSLR